MHLLEKSTGTKYMVNGKKCVGGVHNNGVTLWTPEGKHTPSAVLDHNRRVMLVAHQDLATGLHKV